MRSHVNGPAEELYTLERTLGVTFRDQTLLQMALTHRSTAVEMETGSYERLEFLGDAVVGLVVSSLLYCLFPDFPPGDLTKTRALLVNRPALAEAALDLGLNRYVRISEADAPLDDRRYRSVLADTFEAVIGAVFLDRGWAQARRLVRSVLGARIAMAAADRGERDHKSALQEAAQATERVSPSYRILEETGAAHDRTFTAEVTVGGHVLGTGRGKSKKEAEQAAAETALLALRAEAPSSPGRAIQEENR